MEKRGKTDGSNSYLIDPLFPSIKIVSQISGALACTQTGVIALPLPHLSFSIVAAVEKKSGVVLCVEPSETSAAPDREKVSGRLASGAHSSIRRHALTAVIEYPAASV